MSAHYTGELDLRFLRHGKGEYKYPNGVFRFSGEWKAGTKNGHGVFAVEGGLTFEGNFVDGEIEGSGSKQWADGRRYEGNFSRGEACGEGRFASPAGESYMGTWAQNKRHGRGELVLPNGQGTYAGEFHRHRYHGEGELTLASGFRYSGTFADGLPHGIGAAVYPGGSTFNGPYETGRRNGSGGIYVCGITGICWVGEWAAGNAVEPPSNWSIEPDKAEESVGTGGGGSDQAKTTKPGAKADKGGGKKGGKASKKGIAEPERDDGVEKPVVTMFDGAGAVAGLWCRCVRDVQDETVLPPVPPELQEDAEESTRLAKGRQRDKVSDESGRTLAVTLHEVSESPPGEVGAPVSFFVRRPNATDVSERLGRFPIQGLVALFKFDERIYPKGKTGDGEKLAIVPDAKSTAGHTSVGQVDPDPPAKGSKAPANKSKRGSKIESEQPRPGDDDARWQVIRSEVQSNRCLVIGVGENFSLATPPIFFEPSKLEADGAGERKCGASGEEENAGNCVGSEAAEESKTEMGCALETVQAGNSFTVEPTMMIGRSSPFAVCLDFRIDLMEALLNTEDGQGTTTGGGDDVTGSEGSLPAKDTIVVRIVSCGDDVEVSAVIRLWAPADVEAVRNEVEHAIDRRESEAVGSLASGGASSTGSRARASASGPSPPSGDGDAMAPPTPTWYLHALLVRSGFFTGTVRCMVPVDGALQQRQDAAGAAEPSAPTGTKLPPSGTYPVCDLAEWHALALVSHKDGGGTPVSLCIDGDVIALQQDTDGVVKPDTDHGESSLPASGAVVLGGTGGKWTALAVKNLAVYNEGLGKEEVQATTRVFRSWREEQEEAKAADAQEDERWLEEARKAEEEEREPDKRPEWIVGADSAQVLRAKTVRGEARIDRIVLPEVAKQGGQWVLRVEDVSHGGEEGGGGSAGRARKVRSPESRAAEVVAVAPPTDKELQAFLPLPTETVKLEPA